MSVQRHYYDQPAYVVAGASILGFIAILATVLRIHVRLQQKQPFKADDWLLIPAAVRASSTHSTGISLQLLTPVGKMMAMAIDIAMVYGVSQGALATTQVPLGPGLDPWVTATPQHILNGQVRVLNSDADHGSLHSEYGSDAPLQIQAVVLFLIVVALGLTKSSIVCFYIRIFITTKRSKTYIVLIASLALMVAITVGFFFAYLFQCGVHFEALLGASSIEVVTYCHNSESYDVGFAIADFGSDMLIALLPIPMVRRVKSLCIITCLCELS